MSNALHSRQYVLTVAASKRLIAKGVASLPQVREALQKRTVVILAGTTNGYVAEEILSLLGQAGDFGKRSFFRGVTTPPGVKADPGDGAFLAKDVVLERGVWSKEKNIFDSAPALKSGDLLIKGANAVNVPKRQAGILIGSPELGTSAAILPAAVGRRVELILPVGLEKRVYGDLFELAEKANAFNAEGKRLLPIGGTILTELDAIWHMTGAKAELIAAGGAFGAEGAVWLQIEGTEEQLANAEKILALVVKEPPFTH